MGLTSDLGLRLLGAMVLSEDGCHKDREDRNESTPAQNKHGKGSKNRLYESSALFECRGWESRVRKAASEMVHYRS